jgi:hypothetical protein
MVTTFVTEQAEAGFADPNAYINESEGTTYVQNNKLDPTPWTNASSNDRLVAVRNATQAIDRLQYKGAKADSAQTNQFPRDTDTVVPDAIKSACAELAYCYLDGVVQEDAFDNLTVTSRKFASVSITSKDKASQPHIAAGIPSYEAWVLLLPFMTDLSGVVVERVN